MGDDVCKLILLGNGSVGKSSIISRFVDDGFQKVYKQTVGLDFFEKLITIRGDLRIRLQVWDIGGQNVGSQMLPRYIFGSQAVMLCYDVTDRRSFQDTEDWLNVTRRVLNNASSLSGHKKQAQIFLIGNKIDLISLRQVDKAEHAKFIESNQLDGGHFVSAQSGENVLRSFYSVAADWAGISLSMHELAFTDKVLQVSVVQSDNDGQRTAYADEIERQDRLDEELKNRRSRRGSSVASLKNCIIQ